MITSARERCTTLPSTGASNMITFLLCWHSMIGVKINFDSSINVSDPLSYDVDAQVVTLFAYLWMLGDRYNLGIISIIGGFAQFYNLYV